MSQITEGAPQIDSGAGFTSVQPTGQLPNEYFDDLEITPATNENPRIYPYQYQPFVITDDELLEAPEIQISRYVRKPKEITVYCYPFGTEEVLSKCSNAIPEFDATGLYLPLMAEIGSEREKAYYEQVRRLKLDRPQVKVYGVAYDNPNWTLITQVRQQLWIIVTRFLDCITLPTFV